MYNSLRDLMCDVTNVCAWCCYVGKYLYII